METENLTDGFNPHIFLGVYVLDHIQVMLVVLIPAIGGWIGLRMKNRAAFDRLNVALGLYAGKWLLVGGLLLLVVARVILGIELAEIESWVAARNPLVSASIVSLHRSLSTLAHIIEIYLLAVFFVSVFICVHQLVEHVFDDSDTD